MSEADSPNDQSGSPAPAEPVELSAALDSAAAAVPSPNNSEGWQTIDFPGATSVDAIPHRLAEPVKPRLAEDTLISQGVIHYSSAAIDQATPFAFSAERPDDAALRQQLQDENAALRDRLAQMELDLAQQQIEWQLESAHTQTQSEAAAVTTAASAGVIKSSTLEPINERLSQLLQELERSHQAAQRQQILVETLTEQLESSQERIAQLERDCALTQQRHNEQVQQVLQAEGACRDLRLRLHRQQQQTLQFKAALEKCLEMPTAYGQQVMPDMAIDHSAATPDALTALLKPKNQPVKPWSLPRQAHEPEQDQTERSKPLFKLLNGLSVESNESSGLQDTLPTPADPSALLDSDDPEFVTQLMQLIFPANAEHQASTTDALQAEPIFDRSPFLGTGTVPADATPSDESSPDKLVSTESTGWATESPQVTEAVSQQEDAVPPNASAIDNVSTLALPDDRTTDPLWDNLAALIDPPNKVESSKVTSVVEPTCVNDALDLDPVSGTSIQPIAAWTWRDRLEKASRPQSVAPEKALPERVVSEKATQSPAKLLALSSVSQQTVSQQTVNQQTVSVSSHAESMSAPFATVAPSPIVYPLRATKKLASLAAVDLPTFPKR
ncbi:MAG: hypothetical protein KME42_00440 [Tildeniella nuda ZEHNDER 1965/U140]|jgi:hypothetical protein|nr:hypothetical protein [Tildeniella nuda ZEHNDER 1965/U140]